MMPTIEIKLLGRFAVKVDGVEVADHHWKRRHAAALVKVLALAPGRRLHREQLIDLVWPEDTIDEAVPKLHKAAHYARRALDVPSSVVLRGETVVLCPDADITVDVLRFEEVARGALADEDVVAAREALTLCGGELLPQDRYDAPSPARRSPGPAAVRTSDCSSPRPSSCGWLRRRTDCCSPSTMSTMPTMPVCVSFTTSPGRRAASECASCSVTDRRR